MPTEDDQTYIHDKYINELLKNTVLPDTREELLAIVNRMMGRERIEGVILGGTELPLILPESLKALSETFARECSSPTRSTIN